MQLLEEDRKKIKGALGEISDSMTRVEAEKDFAKEVLKNLYDEFKIPKKTLAKLANTYHRQNFNEEVALNDEFETIYQTVTNQEAE
jgi:nickel-dependent lactate racemase